MRPQQSCKLNGTTLVMPILATIREKTAASTLPLKEPSFAMISAINGTLGMVLFATLECNI